MAYLGVGAKSQLSLCSCNSRIKPSMNDSGNKTQSHHLTLHVYLDFYIPESSATWDKSNIVSPEVLSLGLDFNS